MPPLILNRIDRGLLLFGVYLAFLFAAGAVLTFNFTSSGEMPSPPRFSIVLLSWLTSFLVPPFFTAWRARRSGALYGAILGFVPIVVIGAFNKLPVTLVIVFYIFGIFGGLFGQFASRMRGAH